MTKIQVAYVHDGITIGFNFYQSMMSLSQQDLMPKHISARANTMGLVDARNQLTEYFLDKTDAQYLWWIDSDMGFAEDTPQRLAAHNLDCVGARCYGYGPVAPLVHDGLGGYVTKPYLVAYDLYVREDGFLHYTLIDYLDAPQSDNNELPNKTNVVTEKPSPDYDPIDEPTQPFPAPDPNKPEDDEEIKSQNNLHKVAATGTGCLLVSRKALMLIREQFGDVWFDQVSYPKREGDKTQMRISEDLSFCYRLSVVGIPVHIDMDVRTNHMKTIWVSDR